MASRRFPRGVEYPCEGFVQASLEKWAVAQGLEVMSDDVADLVLRDPKTGKRTVIEAKGLTTSVGLDFNTGLGQLLKRMTDESACYGLAVPDHAAFRRQMDGIPATVRRRLGIHWYVVGIDGGVTVVPP